MDISLSKARLVIFMAAFVAACVSAPQARADVWVTVAGNVDGFSHNELIVRSDEAVYYVDLSRYPDAMTDTVKQPGKKVRFDVLGSWVKVKRKRGFQALLASPEIADLL